MMTNAIVITVRTEPGHRRNLRGPPGARNASAARSGCVPGWPLLINIRFRPPVVHNSVCERGNLVSPAWTCVPLASIRVRCI
jgi:hypothetical protein